ncbi:MAG: hypothetical protein V7731_15585 [Amphritea sp.]
MDYTIKFFVILFAFSFLFCNVNTAVAAFGGVRLLDRFFNWDLSEWEKRFPPDCWWRFTKYSHRYVWGIEQPEMPSIYKIWLWVYYISFIVTSGLFISWVLDKYFGIPVW